MAKPVKSRVLGKNLLLSVAIGATPIVGAAQEVAPQGDEVVLAQANVSGEERSAFDRAAQTGSTALINQFLRQYPNSSLVPQLLQNLPPETLQFVDRGALASISPSSLRSLSPDVRAAIGFESSGNEDDAVTEEDDTPSGTETVASEDPYAG
ncbi:MAG: hypothetical protein AAGB18_05725 [Pseudomonadota bacterium]